MSASSANVAGLIALHDVLGWVLTDNLFTGGLRDGDDVPDLQVAVANYSGTPRETFALSDFDPQVQVMLRGAVDSYDDAEQRAQALWLYLANVRNVQVPEAIGGTTVGPRLIQALTPSGTINPLGRDSQERSLFTMNFTVTV